MPENIGNFKGDYMRFLFIDKDKACKYVELGEDPNSYQLHDEKEYTKECAIIANGAISIFVQNGSDANLSWQVHNEKPEYFYF